MAERHKRAAKSDRKRILIVDDHPIIRQGLVQLLHGEPDMEVCGDAEGMTQGLPAIRELHPDVVIVDLSLKDCVGLDLIKQIRLEFPEVVVLVLSMLDEALYAERALRAGARGYVMKSAAAESLVDALRKVMKGELYLSEAMATQILHKLVGDARTPTVPLDRLSDREFQVFRLIGRGWSTRKIATSLNLSVKTIETYREHIKDKLGLPNSKQLVREAIHITEEQPV